MENQFLTASERGNIVTVRSLLDAGTDVDHANKNGFTALLYASKNGHTETVQILLAAGAKVEHVDEDGNTALMHASYNGHTETVQILLAAGAKVDHVDVDGNTALMDASYKGHTEIVRMLLAAGANVDPELQELIDSGEIRPEIVELLELNESHEQNKAYLANQFKNRSLGTCYDTIMIGDEDIKNVLIEDNNNIIVKSHNTLHCWQRSNPVKYFYACREPTGFIGQNNVLRDKKYVKFGPDLAFITEEDFKKTKDKKFRIFVIRRTEERIPAIASVNVANERGSWVGADHCQEGSDQVLYTLDAYPLREGTRLLLPSNNEQKEGGKGWMSRKRPKRQKTQKRQKSRKSKKSHKSHKSHKSRLTKKRSRRN